jgi:NitT/TauT family transport system ATP-binding protein
VLAVEVSNVSHCFAAPTGPAGLAALQETSLAVSAGELMCLIGPSGCGKSTLLNIIAGLMIPSAGEVRVFGEIVRAPMPRKMAFVFQESALMPWLTAKENLKLALSFQNVPSSKRGDRARNALAAVGMEAFSDHYPRQLSGGMKQRVQIARALSLGTDVLLMDEPFASLDEQTRLVLGEDLSVLLAREGKTIVFVTHSLTEAVFLADRVAVFTARPGRIKTMISVDEGHPRCRSFMTSEKLSRIRNDLYELLHDEVVLTMRQAMGMPGQGAPS